MPNMRSICLALFGASCAMALASAATLSLHVNTGAWEISSKVVMTGDVPDMPSSAEAQLAKLPPEQRAKIAAAMNHFRSDLGKPKTIVKKSCVTQKDLDRPFRWTETKESGCSETVLSATSTDERIQLVCSGKQKGEGDFRFSAPTPSTMVGRVSMTMIAGGRSMNIVNDMSGHWLGADCGALHAND